MQRLKDKVAIVTGSSRGIGKTVAHTLAKEGAKVLIADILIKETRETCEEFRAEGLTADYFLYDQSRVPEVYAMVDFCVETFGRVDLMANCAGVQKPCPSLKVTEEIFDFVMDVDIKGAFFCCQAAGRQMRKQGGGKIVNIASANARFMNLGRAPYCIAKAGVEAMTAVLGAEWAMYGIQVNAVSPGAIMTKMIKENGLRTGAVKEENIMAVAPVERWGTEQEIANIILYLLSSESSYIVGQTVYSDGGWSCGILPHALDYIKENDTIDY